MQLQSIFSRIRLTAVKQKIIAGLVVLVIAGVGIEVLGFSHASTPYAETNASGGTLSGAATLMNGAVQFGTTSSTSSGSTATMLRSLDMLNYYPSEDSWSRMWTNFNPTTINTDFGIMHQMGANSVRLIVQPDAFGYPTPSSAMQSELAQAVSLAQQNGLRVQLTLFDLWSSYTDIAGSTTWANAILGPYKNDSEIAFVEIRNEVNPTDTTEVDWVEAMVPVFKAALGSIPVTTSVTSATNEASVTEAGVAPGGYMDVAQSLSVLMADLQATPLDFYDIHYYGAEQAAYNVLSAAKAEANGVPIFIGETGDSSWDNNQPSVDSGTNLLTESYQDLYIRDVAYAAQALGIGPPAIWAYQDFPPGQGATTGQSTSTVSAQNFYGLLRVDGSYKAAADSVEALFKTGTISTDTNNDFTNEYDGQPLDWTTQFGSDVASGGGLSWDGTTGYNGTGSVELTNTTSGPSNAPPNFMLYPIQNLTSSNQTVTITAWAKTLNATGSNDITLGWYNSAGDYISGVTSSSLTGTNNWTQLSVSGSVPSGAAWFGIHLSSGNNTGTTWFDDVSSTVQ